MLALALLATAVAQNAVDIEAVYTVAEGRSPSVTFLGHTDGHISATLTCSGKRFTLAESIAPGSRSTLTLAGLPTGQHGCAGSLTLTTPDGGEGQMPLKLDVAILPPIQLTAPEDQLDLDARSLVLRSDRPLKRVELRVFGGQAGEEIGGGAVDLSGMTEAPLTWTGQGEVLRIQVVATDTYGVQSELVLLPWSYQIPHEDVIFESGEAAVVEAEAPKLEAAWGHIEETQRKYGAIVEMELFVAGYTDTMGDAASNQALSERRARAIAQWFRKRGFSGPIWTQGFGESVLAVGTPDSTDEPANRRAVYVLAAAQPRKSPDLPRSNWRALP